MIKRAVRKVTVGTTPTKLRDETKPPASGGALYYYDAGTVRLGNSASMTMTANSFPFPAAQQFFDPTPEQTYAMVSAGTVDVWVWELEG